MYKVTKRDCPMFGIGPYLCEFICDTASDITTLPTSISEGTGGKTAYDNQKCASGSIANIAENGSESKRYMLNNQDIWCPYSVATANNGSGSSGSSITIDFALSETSENPVANKVITSALNDKADMTHTHSADEIGADENGSAALALEEAKAYTDSEIAEHTGDSDIHVTASDKDNWNGYATEITQNKTDISQLFDITKGGSDVGGESSYVLKNAVDYPLLGMNLYGKSTQDGVPTPENPVEIVSVESPTVTVCGKNMYVGSQDWSGEWKNDVYYENVTETYLGLSVKRSKAYFMGLKKNLYVEKGKTYIFSCYAKADVDISCKIFILSPGEQINGNALPVCESKMLNVGTKWTRYQLSYTCEKSGYVKPRIEKTAQDGNYLYVCGYQLEESKTMTDYAPYKGSTANITSAMPLCGIPVESGGNYTDGNGQQYVADYVDFERGVKVQSVKTVELSELSWAINTNNNYKYWISYGIPDGKKVEAYNTINNILAEKYIVVSWNQCVIKDNFAKNQIAYTFPEGFAIACQNGSETEKPSGKFIYELATPIETPLSETELQAYRQLQTFNGITNISNDGGADMDVKYCTNKTLSKYVFPITTGLQKQIDELQAAILSLGSNI